MGQVFDLKTGTLAIGDPVMGLVRYSLGLPVGVYRLGSQSLRYTLAQADSEHPLIDLDSPCIFVLDAAYADEFVSWYHQVGNECLYDVSIIADRLPEYENTIGIRVGFYWEHEVAGANQEGLYVLNPTSVLERSEPL